MKKIITLVCCIFISFAFSSAMAQECTTIQEGALTYSVNHYLAGEPLMTGFDPYGYNYQAHMFSGTYCNVYLGGYGFPPYEGDDATYLDENPDAENVWCWPWRNVELLMKWNDAWISNKDCDDEGKLDRHYGFPSYIGSGAWETNHQCGTYVNAKGKKCKWIWFEKIIAVPANASKAGGIWYSAGGEEIGPDIWGQFAIIQSVYNDPCGGYHGIEYLSEDHAGFGGW